jgi:hypothetical protein
MKVKLDETLKTCFAGREQPPPEVKTALEVALRAALEVAPGAVSGATPGAVPGAALRATGEAAPEAALGERPPTATRERRQERETRWVWAVMLYAALFSAAHLFVAWLFTNNEIIVGAFATSFLFSTISAGVIIVACQRERVKGGLNNGTA